MRTTPKFRLNKRDSQSVAFVIQGFRREPLDERTLFLANNGVVFAA